MQPHNFDHFDHDIDHNDGFTLHDGDLAIINDKLYRVRVTSNNGVTIVINFDRLLSHDEFARARHPSAHHPAHDRTPAPLHRVVDGLGGGTVTDVRSRRRSDAGQASDQQDTQDTPPLGSVLRISPPPIPVWGLEMMKEGEGDHGDRHE